MKVKINSHLVFTVLSFVIPMVIYLITMAPTTSFWDCGEFIACSVTLGVPHPPGTPLFLLLGNVFSNFPTFSDIGARVNLISPIASAFSVMFLYLIIIQLIKRLLGDKNNENKIKIAEVSAFIAAITFGVTDSHWFNAVEAEIYSLSTFLTSIVVWLILKWDTMAFNKDSIKYIILIAYIFGLGIGIHLLNLLAIPCVIFIIYYNKKLSSKLNEIDYKKLFIDIIWVATISLTIFGIIYSLIIKGIPQISAQFSSIWFPVSIYIFTLILLAVYVLKNNTRLATIFLCLSMILVGYSTYSTIFIRASQHPSINENNPDTLESFLSYMNREQYGSWSILDREGTLQRQENRNWRRYTDDRNNPSSSEVFSFVWNYQVKEMYLRYFAWQFIGRGDFDWQIKNKDGTITKHLEGIDWSRYIIPLAFIFGIFGFLYHLREDYLRAFSILSLFLATGIMIILYLNQYDPQPRERDYSYVGSFFAFSIWIGIGIFAFLDKLTERINSYIPTKISHLVLSLLLLIAMPINMFANDFKSHNRTGNYVAWDYGYNLLNSCEPNSILFTNGDNDTFPLWYMQEVENIRKDVRVVNLSLLNTPWYIDQLKNEYKTLPINLSDEAIQAMDPLVGTAFALDKWTDEWGRLQNGLNNYFKKNYNQSYNVQSHGIPVDWGPVEVDINHNGHNIKFDLKPTFGSYLKVQDIMVLELIDDMPSDRPIYFAVTVSPGHRLGLDKYLEMEGLVYKFNPSENNNESTSPKLNIKKMVHNITETLDSNSIIKTADDYTQNKDNIPGVYRYTNLNDKDIFFSSNIERLVQNYRSSFLQIAIELISDPSRHKEANEILSMMEKYFPVDVIHITHPDIEIQIGNFFVEIGNMDLFHKYMLHASERTDLNLQQSYFIGQLLLENSNQIQYAIDHFHEMYMKNPDIFEITLGLCQAYFRAGQNDMSIKIIEDWLLSHPNHDEAKEWLKLIKNQI